jgi:hypothetical protein
MSFRTIFDISQNGVKIDYNSNIFLLGSCFSQNIGDKFSYYKFNTIANPFGVLYNPVSISNSIKILLDKREFSSTDLFNHNGLWSSFSHHSSFSDTDRSKVLDSINKQVVEASLFLQKTNLLIITFGTSWVYEYKDSGKVVSNCHKIPSNKFNRYKLTVNKIVEQYVEILNLLKRQNPDINILFTVSPIRHIKDGMEQNQLSKSTLIVAIHELVNMFDNVSYFPSYEIVMDDLRDYRFYNSDMIHPSQTAIDYIWERFRDVNIDSSALSLMIDIDKINKSLSHKSFQPKSEAHQIFLRGVKAKIDKMMTSYGIDFSGELSDLNKKIL